MSRKDVAIKISYLKSCYILIIVKLSLVNEKLKVSIDNTVV